MSTTSTSRTSIELSNPLDALPDDEPLLTKAQSLSKAGVQGWHESENLITPEEAERRLETGKNYGFAAGRGTNDWRLVVFDVEKKEVLPDKAQALIDEHAVLVWDSVHEGRNRLVKVSPEVYEMLDSLTAAYGHLSDESGDDIEIQTNGHVIGPGCKIDHEECSDTKQGCPGSGRSEYELVESRPHAQIITKGVVSDLLDKLGIDYEKETTPSAQSSFAGDLQSPENTKKDVEKMDRYMSELQERNPYPFKDLTQRLKGRVGEKSGLTLAGGYIDRSAVEFVTLSDLYGIARVIGGENRKTAAQLARSYYIHYCQETRRTKKGRPRKWLEMNKTYRKSMIDYATNHFNRDKFYRWLKTREKEETPGLSRRDGIYSETTRNCVYLAVQILSELHVFSELQVPSDEILSEIKKLAMEQVFREQIEHLAEIWEIKLPDGIEEYVIETISNDWGLGSTTDREYPTRQEIVQLAKYIDEDHNKKSTYQKALGNLKAEGEFVLAFCPSYENSERYVYYQDSDSKPDSAKWIESDGDRVSQ